MASIGFLLGLRHALDGDHVAAVATLVARRPTVKTSGFIGFCWGIGHTLVLLLVGVTMVVLNIHLPPAFSKIADAMVGVMLVLLGVPVIWNMVRERWHIHVHHHDDTTHRHLHSHRVSQDHQHDHLLSLSLKPLLVGMVHGLAGSAAVVLLIVSKVHSLFEVVTMLLIFGVGTIVGMMGLGMAITVPVVFWCGTRAPSFIFGLRIVASIGSISLGIAILRGGAGSLGLL